MELYQVSGCAEPEHWELRIKPVVAHLSVELDQGVILYLEVVQV